MPSLDTEHPIRRIATALARHPAAGRSADSPAAAIWTGGLKVTTRHPGGTAIETEMPEVFGGSAAAITPGWYFRASVASCATTSIVLAAAMEDLVLTRIEVVAGSTSDAGGLFGLPGPDGDPIRPGPGDVTLDVVIAGEASADALRSLVDRALRRSPVPDVVRDGAPLVVRVDVA